MHKEDKVQIQPSQPKGEEGPNPKKSRKGAKSNRWPGLSIDQEGHRPRVGRNGLVLGSVDPGGSADPGGGPFGAHFGEAVPGGGYNCMHTWDLPDNRRRTLVTRRDDGGRVGVKKGHMACMQGNLLLEGREELHTPKKPPPINRGPLPLIHSTSK